MSDQMIRSFSTTKTIDIAELRIGMYVSRLEVPWSATEFALQGTLIRSRQDILKISAYGRKVTIDQARSSTCIQKNIQLPYVQKTRSPQKVNVHKQAPRFWRKFCNQNYQASSVIAKEIVQAKRILKQVETVFDEIKQDLGKITPEKVEQVKNISHGIVGSLINNPDALLWLAKVKANRGRVYEHSIRCAIWGALMGRSMGLNRESLNALIQALLLASIGKSLIKNKVWKSYQVEKMSVDYALCSGISISKLRQCKNIDPQILTIIANMNERYDGSGFPCKKQDRQIPYLSQIAGLVESFDLILYPMLSDSKILFGKALSKLYCLADNAFDGALIEEFIQATGLYPAGTQVILSNGEYGVVVEQSKSRRIRATVAITHNAEGYRLLKYVVVRLGEGKYSEVIVQREAEKDHLTKDDSKQINQLIRKYQTNFVSRIWSSISAN